MSGWTVEGRGIHTVSFAWRPDHDLVDTFFKLPRSTIEADGAGKGWGLSRKRDGAWWLRPTVFAVPLGAFRHEGLVVAEGTLSAITTGEAAEQRLAAAENLERGAAAARAALEAVLETSLRGAETFVRRCDIATDIRFHDAREGLAFMAACAAGLHLPRRRRNPHSNDPGTRWSSVDWRTRAGIQERLYDRGELHGTDEPGQLLRLEIQRRFGGNKKTTAEALAGKAGGLYRRAFRTWLATASSVHVAQPDKARRLLFDRMRREELTAAKGCGLLGSIDVLQFGEERKVWTPRMQRERLADLRKHGIHPDLGAGPDCSHLNLRPPIAAFIGSWDEG